MTTTTIKNTLFRFVSLRKPEKLEDSKKQSLFVHHPNPTQSTLYAATKEDFNTNITAFESTAKTKEELKNIDAALYDFGFWILKNRTSVTPESVQAKMNELEITTANTLSSANEIIIWDNFIYQIVTHKDSKALDAAMTLIYANYLLKQQDFQSIMAIDFQTAMLSRKAKTANTNQLKRVLQARIVRPDFIVFDTTTTTPSNNTPASVLSLQTQADFNASLARLNSITALEELNQLANELNSAKKSYQKLEEQNLKIYNTGFKTASDTYTVEKEVYSSLRRIGQTTDPEPIQPEYNYTPLVELDDTRLSTQLSEASYNTLQKVLTNDIATFDELETQIATQRKRYEETATPPIVPTEPVIDVGGVPVTTNNTNPTNNYDFVLEAIKSGIAKWSFNLAIKLPNNNLSIESISYSLTHGSTISTGITFSDPEMENGVLSGILFRHNKVLVSAEDLQGVQLEATIKLSNGETFLIDEIFNLEDGIPVYSHLLSPVVEVTPEETVNQPKETSPSAFGVTRLGIADYRKVEQSICCYVPGEVSHIENIMAREYKERSTRRLRRSENTITSEKSTETETQTDTTSTERNEMQQELSKMEQQSKDFSANAGISGSFPGGSTFSANTSFAFANSKEQSENMSRTEAQEITEKLSERILSKVREERINKIIDEFEEQNKHGFDNRKGSNHISGVYRWIDKVYKNEIFNYGKRLMYEFMIPEPAKFHNLFLQEATDIKIEKPLDPRTVHNNPIKTFKDINENNYQIWASVFNASVDTPPVDAVIFSKSYSATSTNTDAKGGWEKSWNDIQIENGYELTGINCTHEFRRGYGKEDNTNTNSNIQIGTFHKVIQKKSGGFGYDFGYESNSQSFSVPMSSYLPKDNNLPVSVACWDVSSFTLNVVVKARRTTALYEQWKIETFNAIIQAYEDKLAIYEQKVAALKAEAKEKKRINPLYHRSIENKVLRKNCIAYLIKYKNMGMNFQVGDTMSDHSIATSYTDSQQKSTSLVDYANKVKFLEQAFEWENMSYIFYPFYWGNKENWNKSYMSETDDVLFARFLESGMARVIATVRPGFEDAVNWFLETGQVWQGENPPVIGDDLYLSIVDELQNPEYYIEGSWETRVPSTLTVIQNGSIGLNATGLPCECDRVYDEEGNVIEGSKDEITQNDDDVHLEAPTDSSEESDDEGVDYWVVNPDE